MPLYKGFIFFYTGIAKKKILRLWIKLYYLVRPIEITLRKHMKSTKKNIITVLTRQKKMVFYFLNRSDVLTNYIYKIYFIKLLRIISNATLKASVIPNVLGENTGCYWQFFFY